MMGVNAKSTNNFIDYLKIPATQPENRGNSIISWHYTLKVNEYIYLPPICFDNNVFLI